MAFVVVQPSRRRRGESAIIAQRDGKDIPAVVAQRMQSLASIQIPEDGHIVRRTGQQPAVARYGASQYALLVSAESADLLARRHIPCDHFCFAPVKDL